MITITTQNSFKPDDTHITVVLESDNACQQELDAFDKAFTQACSTSGVFYALAIWPKSYVIGTPICVYADIMLPTSSVQTIINLFN